MALKTRLHNSSEKELNSALKERLTEHTLASEAYIKAGRLFSKGEVIKRTSYFREPGQQKTKS